MRILIDESLPRDLRQMLSGHQVATVQEMGWAGVKNGELLQRIGSNFDVFLTADKNLRYQQNLEGIKFALVVFSSNRLRVVMEETKQLDAVFSSIQVGDIIELAQKT